jgi:repressor LexA
MEELTQKQEKMLSFIKGHVRKKGYPPSIREMVAHFRFKSLNTVAKYLAILAKKGHIRRNGGCSRAIELIGEAAFGQSRLVPVVGQIQAGTPHLAVENIDEHLALDSGMARWDNSFFLRVKGDSMIEAHIQEGDFALIKPQATAHNGEMVAVLLDDEATLKYFYKREHCIELVPANPAYRPIMVLPEEPVRIIGTVVGIVRKYGMAS